MMERKNREPGLTRWQRLCLWIGAWITRGVDEREKALWRESRVRNARAQQVASIVEAIERRGIVWDAPEEIGGSGGVSIYAARDRHREVKIMQPEGHLVPPEAVPAEYVRELEQHILTAGTRHAEEIARIRREHAEHLARVEHGDCISTAAHKQTMAELRDRMRAFCPKCGKAHAAAGARLS